MEAPHAAVVTQEFIKDRFNYEDGKLFWKKTFTNRVKSGMIAGTRNQLGYIQINISINKKKHIFLAHRLIYLYHYGFMPKEIDHINLDKSDNRIENLREATRSQNIVNNKPRKDNVSGHRGIYFCKRSNKWIGRIWFNNKKIWAKSFLTLNDAIFERKKQMSIYYKDFVRI